MSQLKALLRTRCTETSIREVDGKKAPRLVISDSKVVLEPKCTLMTSPTHRPKVGVGVFVVRHGKFIVGRRTGSHGHGTLQLPGGHLENGETWTECAKREVLEETGIELTRPVDFLTATNDVFDEIKHYVTIFMVAKLDDCHVEPQVLEPDKCQSWEWMSLGSLQRLYHDDRGHLFLPLINLLRERRDQVEAALGSS